MIATAIPSSDKRRHSVILDLSEDRLYVDVAHLLSEIEEGKEGDVTAFVTAIASDKSLTPDEVSEVIDFELIVDRDKGTLGATVEIAEECRSGTFAAKIIFLY